MPTLNIKTLISLWRCGIFSTFSIKHLPERIIQRILSCAAVMCSTYASSRVQSRQHESSSCHPPALFYASNIFASLNLWSYTWTQNNSHQFKYNKHVVTLCSVFIVGLHSQEGVYFGEVSIWFQIKALHKQCHIPFSNIVSLVWPLDARKGSYISPLCRCYLNLNFVIPTSRTGCCQRLRIKGPVCKIFKEVWYFRQPAWQHVFFILGTS